MTEKGVLNFVLSKGFCSLSTLQEIFSEDQSNFQKRLMLLGIPRALSPFQSAAISLVKELTERDVQFVRKHFGGLSTVKRIRQSKKKFMATTPNIYTLHERDSLWNESLINRSQYLS